MIIFIYLGLFLSAMCSEIKHVYVFWVITKRNRRNILKWTNVSGWCLAMLQTEIHAVLRLSYFVFYSVFPKYLGLYKRYLHEILFQESAFVETPTYKFLYKLVNNYGRKWPKDKIMKINLKCTLKLLQFNKILLSIFFT